MSGLTPQQTAVLRASLDKRTGELAAQIRAELAASDNQHYRELAGMVTDRADEALADTLVDVEVALIDRHLRELRDIDAARERMRNDRYGVCIDCEEAVPCARLTAYSTAKRCLTCQQRREKTHMHENIPRL